eukprot:CAMPEP_0119394930 /NCGR_PEP_ID=MMETSP1334-20130426/131413_1 /TAXON_ID=127549 /ORGANISM="Calcidiscus leptoporus, Strain RCC1130" /LENGTH=78 /DNA_ID=CAMNT_0007418313 /DNA_START=281 /DNA_END=515 /DNA_ORIENTATION=+
MAIITSVKREAASALGSYAAAGSGIGADDAGSEGVSGADGRGALLNDSTATSCALAQARRMSTSIHMGWTHPSHKRLC